MIETWRQVVHRVGGTLAVGGAGRMAAGPLRAGGILTEVRLLAQANGRAATQFSMALAGTPSEDDAAYAAATPLMFGPGIIDHFGKPAWYEGVETAFHGQRVFPFAVRIDSGSRWVMLYWAASETYNIYVVMSVTVVGYARIGADGLGVEDGLDR